MEKKNLIIGLPEFDFEEISILAVKLHKPRKKLIELIINGITHDEKQKDWVKSLVDFEDGII